MQEEERRERAVQAVRETDKANQALLALRMQQKEQERMDDAKIEGSTILRPFSGARTISDETIRASGQAVKAMVPLQTTGQRRPQKMSEERQRLQLRQP